jgi:very-short-patch-repair endonuclease
MPSAPIWTASEDCLLKENYANTPKKRILELIPEKNWQAIRKRAVKKGLTRNIEAIRSDQNIKKKRCDGWAEDELDKLKLYYTTHSKADLLAMINRSWCRICEIARELGLKRQDEIVSADRKIRAPKRADSYREEELELIRLIYENNSKEYILNKFQEKGWGRSWQSIRLNAKNLGLNRDPQILKQEMIEGGKTAPDREDTWTETENAILKQVYENSLQKDVMTALPGRTWKAIREHTIRAGLRRSVDMINQDRDEKSRKTMQERYGVDYSTQLPSMQEKTRQTNLKNLGVEYPTQSQEVRDKAKKTVQERFGVDNVFQAESIKEQITKTNMEKFGVPNPNQCREIQDKKDATTLERHGVKNPFQMTDRVKQGMIEKHGYGSPLKVPEIKAQQQQTNLERYGSKTPAGNAEVREKTEQTNLERYGVKTPFQNEDIKTLIKQTNLERYGVDNPLKSEDIQNKARQTLYKHGTQKCSKQQLHLATVLNKVDKINYPIGTCNADILIDEKIICEYDGGGHTISMKFKNGLTLKEFSDTERKRDLFLKSLGFSIIRIVSREDLIPEDTIILKMISEAIEYLKSGHSWITFDLDHRGIICSQFQKQYDFGKLSRLR